MRVQIHGSPFKFTKIFSCFILGTSKCQSEPILKNSNPKEFLQSAEPYSSKCQFGLGSSNSQFEPANKNSNSRGFLQSAQPYGSKSQFENGRRAPAFEPFDKNKTINLEKGEFETEIDETGTANEKVETKNRQKGRPKAQNKKSTLTIQKFSNHIKFIDYIPTLEIITYRHLFAYGFYVE